MLIITLILLIALYYYYNYFILGADHHAHPDPRTQGAARKNGGGKSFGFRVEDLGFRFMV